MPAHTDRSMHCLRSGRRASQGCGGTVVALTRERNVLVFPGGTEIGLEIRQALVSCKEIRLFSAAAPGSNHAPFAYSVHDEVPDMTDETWFDAFGRSSVDGRLTTSSGRMRTSSWNCRDDGRIWGRH